MTSSPTTSEVSIRPYAASDAPALAELLFATWSYGVSDPALGFWKGLYDLYLELERSSVALVAELEGTAVGVIVARDPFLGDAGLVSPHDIREAADHLATSEEGRQAMRYLSGERQIHDELLSQIEDPFACEITLLVCSSAVKGRGLGKALLEALLSELARRGVEGVHLYTDTFCNWEFYERRGFTRAAEQSLPAGAKDSAPATAFLYEKALVDDAREDEC